MYVCSSMPQPPMMMPPQIQGGEEAMDQKEGWKQDGKHGKMGIGMGAREAITYVKFNHPF